MAGVTINPALVTNAPGSFFVSSEGYIQGTALNDPAVRNELQQGVLAVAQQTPVWGGCGITASIAAGVAGISPNIMAILALATSQANLTGFTVFDQSLAMIQSPQSPVPLAPGGDNVSVFGGAINFYEFGCGARIVVPCTSTVAAALAGAASNVALYWDYTNQRLLNAPGGTAIAAKLIDVDTKGNSKVVSYNSGTGFATWTENGYSAVIQI